jgi:D-alanyl-D-alanine carboxypeptidase/D-alanyl-D-alanine-endopeptidase (penicillin-binding protein 4)
VLSSRGLRSGTIAIAVAAVAVCSLPARSQRTGSGSEAPTSPEPDGEDDGAAAGGSGSALVAPQEPKARAAWLRDRMAAAIASRPALATVKIAFAAQDLSTGQDLVSREPDRGMTIASNAKLLTSVAALLGLGGGFRWRTAVFAAAPDDKGTVPGDLYLRGRGDPTLSVAALRQLAADIAARGVRTIEGRLVMDTTYFDGAAEPPHFDEQPKERAAFRAPVASLGVNRSAITVSVMQEPGGGARVTLDPPCDYVRLAKAEVTSVDKGRTRLRVDQRTRAGAIELDVTGQLRIGEGAWDVRRRVDDPARYAAELFRKALADQGVRIRSRAIVSGTVPLTLKLLAHHDSAPLSDVLRLVNKHSDNYVAESVLKTLGAETKGTPGPATWADGLAAMRAQLAKIGLQPDGYRCGNGSGLFASTEVSAKQLLVLLAAAHRDYRIGPDLVASLPVGGQDGTLARRWVGRPAMGRVRAKTGTLDKVSTLAGYIGVDGGHLLAFAILVNDIPPGQRATVRAMADEMVEVLAAYLGAT